MKNKNTTFDIETTCGVDLASSRDVFTIAVRDSIKNQLRMLKFDNSWVFDKSGPELQAWRKFPQDTLYYSTSDSKMKVLKKASKPRVKWREIKDTDYAVFPELLSELILLGRHDENGKFRQSLGIWNSFDCWFEDHSGARLSPQPTHWRKLPKGPRRKK